MTHGRNNVCSFSLRVEECLMDLKPCPPTSYITCSEKKERIKPQRKSRSLYDHYSNASLIESSWNNSRVPFCEYKSNWLTMLDFDFSWLAFEEWISFEWNRTDRFRLYNAHFTMLCRRCGMGALSLTVYFGLHFHYSLATKYLTHIIAANIIKNPTRVHIL